MSQCNRSTAGFDPCLLYPDPESAAPAPSVGRRKMDRIVTFDFIFHIDGQTDASKPSHVKFRVRDTLSQHRRRIGHGTMIYSVSQIYEDDRVLKIN